MKKFFKIVGITIAVIIAMWIVLVLIIDIFDWLFPHYSTLEY